METNIKQRQFEIINDFRGFSDAAVYHAFTLELFFYKGLSERLLQMVVLLADRSLNEYDTVEKQINLYRDLIKDEDIKAQLQEKLQASLEYVIEPQYLFYSLTEYAKLRQGLQQLIKKYTQFDNLFSTLLQVGKEHKGIIGNLLQRLNELNELNQSAEKASHEFIELLDRFAIEDGRRGNYTGTPASLRSLVTKLVMLDQANKSALTVFDPTMGTGNLMFELQRSVRQPKEFCFYGTEINRFSFKLAKTIAILCGIKQDRLSLQQRDALAQNWPIAGMTQFNVVVMQPPFSSSWSAATQFKTDTRFSHYPRLAPKTKADFAFLLHGYSHLKPGGTMVIILPHGILFRGAAEQEIRKQLVLDGSIDAVIGLPANIMTTTSIPIVAIILKKQRSTRDILFVDASHEFTKSRVQNKLTGENITKILTTYRQRKAVDKYAYVADLTEIEQNKFNLNIPRYVDTFETEPPLDLVTISSELREIRREKTMLERSLVSAVGNIGSFLADCKK